MTDAQLTQLARLTIQNSERLNSISQIVNTILRNEIISGRLKENAAFLLSRLATEDAFCAVEEKKKAERRAFFGLA